jgi:hypothetical protein
MSTRTTPTDTPAPIPALAAVLSSTPPGPLSAVAGPDGIPVATAKLEGLASLAGVVATADPVPEAVCNPPGIVDVGVEGKGVGVLLGPIVAANANMLEDVLQHDFGPQHHLFSPHEFTGAFSSCHYAIAFVSRVSSVSHADYLPPQYYRRCSDSMDSASSDLCSFVSTTILLLHSYHHRLRNSGIAHWTHRHRLQHLNDRHLGGLYRSSKNVSWN